MMRLRLTGQDSVWTEPIHIVRKYEHPHLLDAHVGFNTIQTVVRHFIHIVRTLEEVKDITQQQDLKSLLLLRAFCFFSLQICPVQPGSLHVGTSRSNRALAVITSAPL